MPNSAATNPSLTIAANALRVASEINRALKKRRRCLRIEGKPMKLRRDQTAKYPTLSSMMDYV